MTKIYTCDDMREGERCPIDALLFGDVLQYDTIFGHPWLMYNIKNKVSISTNI